MTAREWFQAYTDAVSTAVHVRQFGKSEQEELRNYWGRTIGAYRAAKGLAYADSVAVQTDALLEGVEAMRKGVVP